MNIRKLPLIKQIVNYIEDVQFEKDMIKMDEYYISEYETEDTKYIWGILSYDDLSNSNTATMWTMNDFDLIYHKNIHKYSLSIETIYMFKENGQYGYMQSLLDEFTKWMELNNYKTNRTLSLHEVFTEGISINTQFDSIEEAYSAFKLLVNGFCSLKKEAVEEN